MKSRSLKSYYYRTAAPTVLAMMIWSGSALAQERVFNVPAQDARRAIPEFARQAGIEILAPSEKLRGVRMPAIQGMYDVHEALAILLAGTGLTIASEEGKFITLRNQATPTLSKIAAVEVQVAQASSAPAASSQAAQAAPVEEIVVTGSRIIREGYEAPTPLTVVGAEALASRPDANLVDFLNSMPAVSGSNLPSSGQNLVNTGTVGLQILGLRSLGTARALVLLDGQRVVSSSVTGAIDVGTFPQQLVQRVDMITGGASAVYGSDAVSGVVNFILDRKFTGVKGEISGGLTNYGDGKNYKVDMSAGFGFADDRGHVLLSGEQLFNKGIQKSGDRDWNKRGVMYITNPTYSATNGQPQYLLLDQVAVANATLGGVIVSGPLKGTAFGSGGTPYKYQYGPLVSGNFMQGGDWAANNVQPNYDLDPVQSRQNVFTRVSYDVTDNLNMFIQYSWSQMTDRNDMNTNFILGGATGPTIKIDNAYLPDSVRAAMTANGLTTFQFGTLSADFKTSFGDDDLRVTNSIHAGVEGNFEAMDTTWRWSTYYAYGATKGGMHNPGGVQKSRFALAIDAVVNPANGQIVCRSTLTNPTNGCKPWNALGIGVNTGNDAAYNWMNNNGIGSFQHILNEETVYSASITGEPFSVPAGPVSVAVNLEHRLDSQASAADQYSTIFDHYVGNYGTVNGSQSVTEGSLETVIPLAKNESWAKSWDFTAAVRFTGYSLAGYVTTYKFGTTYAPIDDLKFRITRSRDIRAPTLYELFLTPQITLGSIFLDRFRSNETTPGTMGTATVGNPNLVPEKGDTTGIGVVFSPTFIDGFTASVDFWDVAISGALQAFGGQQIIDTCFDGTHPELCGNITRDSTGRISQINVFSINLASQNVRGLDLEASYRIPMSKVVDDWRGDLSLHGLMTFYLRDRINNTFIPTYDRVGQNGYSLGEGFPPNWKFDVTATYALDPVVVSVTGRGVSSGKFDSTYIECTSGCPTSTATRPTINNNFLGGRFYMDANVTYKMTFGETTSGEFFISAKNLLNTDPPLSGRGLGNQFFISIGSSPTLYDQFGTVYRAGLRFKM